LQTRLAPGVPGPVLPETPLTKAGLRTSVESLFDVANNDLDNLIVGPGGPNEEAGRKLGGMLRTRPDLLGEDEETVKDISTLQIDVGKHAKRKADEEVQPRNANNEEKKAVSTIDETSEELLDLQARTSPGEIRGMESNTIKTVIRQFERGSRTLESSMRPLVRAVSARAVLTSETRNQFERALVTATARERLAREIVERLRAELNRRP
jgi:hypothetical protein